MTSDILSLQQTSGWRHWEYGHHGGLWRWDDVIFLQLNQRFDSFDVITFASFFCLKRSIISSHRVSNWENPAVSHTLWWLKNSVKIIWSNVVMEKWLGVLCLFSHCAVAWWRRLLWRESHLHRHREHFVSSQLLTWWQIVETSRSKTKTTQSGSLFDCDLSKLVLENKLKRTTYWMCVLMSFNLLLWTTASLTCYSTQSPRQT